MFAISETQIKQWAEHHEARSKLPVLVRRLITETTCDLLSLRFPGGNAVDLPSFDGITENAKATPWVPAGKSIWEMGCNENIAKKANEDYIKRSTEVDLIDRQKTTFIFVTPRQWPKKEYWIQEKKNENKWFDVRAYDAIDLATWLETTVSTSIWFEEIIGCGNNALMSSEKWWKNWSSVISPPLSYRIVATRRGNPAKELMDKIKNHNKIISIKAENKDEAIAFIIASLYENRKFEILDRILIVIPKIHQTISAKNCIIISSDNDEYIDYVDRNCIVFIRPYSKGRYDIRDAIEIQNVPHDVFQTELLSYRGTADEANKLANHIGHSIPVLRRYLSTDPEIKFPSWARNATTAKQLLPIILCGSFSLNKDVKDDLILSELSNNSEVDYYSICTHFLSTDDSPLIKLNEFYIIASQLDAVFAIGHLIERSDLDLFYDTILRILSERAPELDLDRKDWYAASIYGKVRPYSKRLLPSMLNMLCILSIHGNKIINSRFYYDFNYKSEQLVINLLKNADSDRWLSIRNFLSELSESAPEAFLSSIEDNLKNEEPSITALLQPSINGSFDECIRADLLWALEKLAWFPEYFERVAIIIFELCKYSIKDLYCNNPLQTAKSLFRVWLPSTIVSINNRFNILRKFEKKYRFPIFEILISLFPCHTNQVAIKNPLPEWRIIDENIHEVTAEEITIAVNFSSQIIVNMIPFSKKELQEIVCHVEWMQILDREKFVEFLKEWSKTASDKDKADLKLIACKHKIDFKYRSIRHDDIYDFMNEIINIFEPKSVIYKYKWMFDSEFYELDYFLDEGFLCNHEDISNIICSERVCALEVLIYTLTMTDIVKFALQTIMPNLVARHLIYIDNSLSTSLEWIKIAFNFSDKKAIKNFIRVFIIDNVKNVFINLDEMSNYDSKIDMQIIVELLPLSKDSWSIIDSYGDKYSKLYWNSVSPFTMSLLDNFDLNYAINKLLETNRPRSAFYVASLMISNVDCSVCYKILLSLSAVEENLVDMPDAYHINKMIEHIEESGQYTNEEIARIEFPFLRFLCTYCFSTNKRALAVHKFLSESPRFFVQMIAFKYSTNIDECIYFDDINFDHIDFYVKIAFDVFHYWNLPPGYKNGFINDYLFNQWIDEVKILSSKYDLVLQCNFEISDMLARFSKKIETDIFLPDCALSLLNSDDNEAMRNHFIISVANSRGVVRKAIFEGGTQEMALAFRFRTLANKYKIKYPRLYKMFNDIAFMYDNESKREDYNAIVSERWGL